MEVLEINDTPPENGYNSSYKVVFTIKNVFYYPL